MAMDLPKVYDPQDAQKKWLEFWQQRGFFHNRPDPARKPFSIVIPPPNVTGALHLGHALNNVLQDILIRFRRAQGFNALWIPGTDHAGIGTQAAVERLIFQQEGKTRHDIGRDELVRRIWDWKDKFESRILNQLRTLGSSCDWERTRFTLDATCARAVRQTFFNLFRDGVIYRGKRLVNWDTQLQTAVADDETYHETIKGSFWTFRYPVQPEGAAQVTNEFIRFSTTRPETMLGDTAVAVHPDDPRYQQLIGKKVLVPLVGRVIPIIADAELVDPQLGTGAVKVTPAHDPNDYACGLRQNLPMINILNPDGTINANGGPYAGMDRFEARERVVEAMDKLGLFDGREERDIDLAHSDRSKTPIEPYLSDQWFVTMADLAQSALDAVEDGRITFFPPRYAKTYLDWLSEKRDWCISRQLWWGHRIPIWYTRCPEAELKKAFAGRQDVVWRLDQDNGQWLICGLEDIPADALGPKYPLEQDPDVLDTWFSSALWPHSTMGWPEPTPELAYYYPTSVLVTSRDIITLWVARMVITGLYNVKKIPFHHVYIHPKILDGFGETMSKSKGNGVDPLDIVASYGADALRFVMAQMATETQDSRMPVANMCPHCQALVPQKKEHMSLRTRKITCPSCKKPFRPGGPWPADDPELKTARQVSDRFEMGRNFATKIWNAARFLFMNLDGYKPEAVRFDSLPIEDRWVLSRLAGTTAGITAHLENYRFSDAARALYEFTWSEFCEWYVEMSKDRLRDPSSRPVVQRILCGVLDAVVRLTQPIMPFVAESIWQVLNETAFERGLPGPEPSAESVVIAPWPEFPTSWHNPAIETRLARMQDLVRAVREVRNRYKLDNKTPLDIFVKCNAAVADDLRQLAAFLATLAGVGRLELGPTISRPSQAAGHVAGDFEAYIALAGLIDVPTEIKRLEKTLAEKRKHLQAARAKLENPSFRDRAPAEVVQQQVDLVVELERQIQALESNMAELAS
jgi:valyl-tRNA synthetase